MPAACDLQQGMLNGGAGVWASLYICVVDESRSEPFTEDAWIQIPMCQIKKAYKVVHRGREEREKICKPDVGHYSHSYLTLTLQRSTGQSALLDHGQR
jgi:hypothetical protein